MTQNKCIMDKIEDNMYICKPKSPKGVNESYNGQALDDWKINWCIQTSCTDCKCLDPWQFDSNVDCGGRYAV